MHFLLFTFKNLRIDFCDIWQCIKGQIRIVHYRAECYRKNCLKPKMTKNGEKQPQNGVFQLI